LLKTAGAQKTAFAIEGHFWKETFGAIEFDEGWGQFLLFRVSENSTGANAGSPNSATPRNRSPTGFLFSKSSPINVSTRNFGLLPLLWS
jgi:hypothetical protein